MDFCPETLEHPVITLAGKRFVRLASGIFDRTTHHDAGRSAVQATAGMAGHLFQEETAEVLEPEALAEDDRLLEAPARRDRLERLKETAVGRIFEIFGDRPRPCI